MTKTALKRCQNRQLGSLLSFRTPIVTLLSILTSWDQVFLAGTFQILDKTLRAVKHIQQVRQRHCKASSPALGNPPSLQGKHAFVHYLQSLLQYNLAMFPVTAGSPQIAECPTPGGSGGCNLGPIQLKGALPGLSQVLCINAAPNCFYPAPSGYV